MTDDEIDKIIQAQCDHTLYALEWERALFRAGMEAAAKICESEQVNRPDDPLANSFDGGLRFCARTIRAAANDQ